MADVRRREGMSREQRRVMEVIARQEAAGEDGHDLEGALSSCSRNLPATVRSLERRGFVKGTHDPYAAEGEEWTWNLTRKGCGALGIEP